MSSVQTPEPKGAQVPRVMPVSFFGMAVGTLAWAQAWQAAASLWSLPESLPGLAKCAGLLVWLTVLTVYGHKWWAHTAQAQAELQHPVQSAMLALVPVATLLAAMALQTMWPPLALAVYAVGMTAQLALGVWLHGRFWQGGRAPESITAVVYLPAVAQNFVAGTASVAFGWPELGALLFGAGMLSWLALESLIVSRAAVHAPLAEAQRPLLGIQMAPAVVGGLTYLSLTSGEPDLMAKMLFGYGLYQAALALRLLPWISQQAFVPSYWAFSFGVMALATMGLRLHARAPQVGLWQVMAPVLFVGANAVFVVLAWRTLALWWRGHLLPVDASPIVPPVAS